MNDSVFLMYHELEFAGRPLCQSDPGYVRYVIAEDTFRDQLTWLAQQGFRGLSVDEALSRRDPKAVVITFDDGSETDLLSAAPALAKLGFSATFYVTTGFLHRPGYLSKQQLRELAASGFDIGSHSISHPYLSDLSRDELRREILQSKDELEQILGKPVVHFSCPGGRWSREAASIARSGGYRSVCSSRIGVNHQATDPFNLARIAVTRTLGFPQFQDICRRRGLWRLQLHDLTRAGAKRLLGNSVYDRLRARALQP
jgi:peptidoglycan/xylan/chitin deacetylase (PgdA/CDA1 family)